MPERGKINGNVFSTTYRPSPALSGSLEIPQVSQFHKVRSM